MALEELKARLDSFDGSVREHALDELAKKAASGDVRLPAAGSFTNLHFHTFFSFNCCGYSPSRIAWLAKETGLAVAGIVDFDVLDGVDEFLQAAQKLGLKACAGLESRVFVAEFADKVMNSPGEPGIAYHMGTGFPTAAIDKKLSAFAGLLRKTARDRNEILVEKVNAFLAPVTIDYSCDVLPLTPEANATERHICLAYAQKAAQVIDDSGKLAKFWSEKLTSDITAADLPNTVKLLNLIRAKTMKRGGAGYVQPDAKSFPSMEDMNNFVLAAGGIPTLAWLDGTSDGEQQIERLLKIAMASGVAAVNIIPDRNYTPGLGAEDKKCKNLYEFVAIAQTLDLPIIAGTEMNSPGQKFVDDFNSKELAPLTEVFLKGAHIVYAHSVLQRAAGLGYVSKWAKDNFESAEAKNEFFETFGKLLEPSAEKLLNGISEKSKPQDILNLVKK